FPVYPEPCRSTVTGVFMRLTLNSVLVATMTVLPVPLNVLAEQQAILDKPLISVPAALPVPNPTRSFWIDSPNANPYAKEGSEGPLTADADICIIGSGITGVSAAYHLSNALHKNDAAKPSKIVILEARDFCQHELSLNSSVQAQRQLVSIISACFTIHLRILGRNGGHLTPTVFKDFQAQAAAHGTDEALRALAVEHHTADEILRILHELGQERSVDLVAGGHVDLMFTEAEVIRMKGDYEAAKAAGVNVSDAQWLKKDETEAASYRPMSFIYGAAYPGVRIPGHNLWPLKLVTLLFNGAKDLCSSRHALALHTRTPVTAISTISSDTSSPRRWNVTTPRGSIACSYVLHATNAYASHLLPHMHGHAGIIPTRGQVIAVRAAVPTTALTRSGFSGNEGFEYWFPRPVTSAEETPLVILGGGRESTRPAFELYTVDDSVVNKHVGEALRKFLPSVFPGKYEVGREPEMEWTGIMGFTKSGDPFVGPVIDPSKPDAETAYKGQYISAGYSGHGMTRAFACAEAVAQMIAADMTGDTWTPPAWLPRHYVTTTQSREP
ncbi:hypothetical protein A0H81_06486, partial [Grifola frondosa]